jgi:N-acyl-D-aspartate/D-glutamate deacylase
LPVWRDLRALPLAEQRQRLHDPQLRRRLVEAADGPSGRHAIGTEARDADYDWILVFDTVEGPHRTVAAVARERGQHPAETMIDLALSRDLDLFFLQRSPTRIRMPPWC